MKNKRIGNGVLNVGLFACAKSLRYFGYHDVATEMIREIHTAWHDGRELPHGIIGQLAVRNFEDYPNIFGVPIREEIRP